LRKQAPDRPPRMKKMLSHDSNHKPGSIAML
jgi:hypothetical protein